jgi:hypothetical protein
MPADRRTQSRVAGFEALPLCPECCGTGQGVKQLKTDPPPPGRRDAAIQALRESTRYAALPLRSKLRRYERCEHTASLAASRNAPCDRHRAAQLRAF